MGVERGSNTTDATHLGGVSFDVGRDINMFDLTKIPKPKFELLVQKLSMHTLEIHVSTPRALEWIRSQADKFTYDHHFCTQKPPGCKLPVEIMLLVSPCYSIEDVIEYLSKPAYGNKQAHVVPIR